MPVQPNEPEPLHPSNRQVYPAPTRQEDPKDSESRCQESSFTRRRRLQLLGAPPEPMNGKLLMLQPTVWTSAPKNGLNTNSPAAAVQSVALLQDVTTPPQPDADSSSIKPTAGAANAVPSRRPGIPIRNLIP